MKLFSFVALTIFIAQFAFAEERLLTDSELQVARSDYKEIHFRVPEEATGKVEFQGTFKTVGGLNDDITFMVFDQENYVRWFNQYRYKALVKREKIKEADFRFDAEPGKTYYFVLNNFFSSVSGKKVKLQIKLILADNPQTSPSTESESETR
jgi:emp24/gp25L/p24 family/GOLD